MACQLTELSTDKLREWTSRRALVPADIRPQGKGSPAQFTWQTILVLRIAVLLRDQFSLELQAHKTSLDKLRKVLRSKSFIALWGQRPTLQGSRDWVFLDEAGGLPEADALVIHLDPHLRVVRGFIEYDPVLVTLSIVGSLPLFAMSLSLSGERNRRVRPLSAPVLLLAIGVLHLTGMASLRLTFDPRIQFPSLTLKSEILAPIVAVVCVGLFAVALAGLRLTLHAQATLRRERQRLGELANLALEGLAICDGDSIVTANESLERLTGRSKLALAGLSLKSLVPTLDIASLPEREEAEAKLVNAEGEFVPVRVIRSEVRLGLGSQTVVAFRDQRERLRSEERIRTLAFSDHLTGLANRTRFLELVELSVEDASASGRGFAILLVDLDGFKGVNDGLGHHGGDEVLRIISQRLQTTVAAEHMVARLGGDEFAVLTRDGSDPLRMAALGSTLITAIEEPIPVADQIVRISASIGGVLSSDRRLDPVQLLDNADLALYDAKANGRGRVRIFTQELRQTAVERSVLMSELEMPGMTGTSSCTISLRFDYRTVLLSAPKR